MNNFRDAEFRCDDEARWYKGKHRPNVRWNGWAVPYFTKETAEAILRNIPDSTFRYDESRDTFIMRYQDFEDHEWEGVLIDGVGMYAIGAYNWTWVAREIYQEPFPNGFTSWMETHHEVVAALTIELMKEKVRRDLELIREMEGRCGFYTLAANLTDEFERLNAGREWDGEFFDEIESFIQTKLP